MVDIREAVALFPSDVRFELDLKEALESDCLEDVYREGLAGIAARPEVFPHAIFTDQFPLGEHLINAMTSKRIRRYGGSKIDEIVAEVKNGLVEIKAPMPYDGAINNVHAGFGDYMDPHFIPRDADIVIYQSRRRCLGIVATSLGAIQSAKRFKPINIETIDLLADDKVTKYKSLLSESHV